ncbi:MAG: NFACT family protein [Candidatus Gastranaerophilales bacterium]|nr:NFACT family protein [Candidatus Gastranaerophilales bacterium]
MINFDALTLKAFVEENREFLTGAAIKKIQQPSRRELLIQLRNNGENKKLYININPEFFHLCFVEDTQKRGITIPNEAPMFCMLLRKYIQNGKITKIVQPFGERILEMHFEYRDSLGDTNTICLAAELMGKYSNIILYNFDTKIIIGCAHNVGEEKSKYRELAGTLPYIYPEKQNKSDILSESEENFVRKFTGNFDEISLSFAVANEYYYLTNPLVKQVIKALNGSDFDERFLKKLFLLLQKTVSLQDIKPSADIENNEFSLFTDSGFKPFPSVNKMINDYFEHNMLQKLLKQRKQKITLILDSHIKKLLKQTEIFRAKLLETEKADNYKIKADILMMNINAEIKPKITLFNPYDNQNTEIELDTNCSIIQNANRYYKLYKKTKTAIEYAENKIEETEALLEEKEQQKFYTEIASNLEEIEEIEEEIGIKTDKTKEKRVKKEHNLDMREIGGFKVYLGKNSVQNDYLLSKIAAPEDLWFHPLNMHGAHVILKCGNQKVDDEVLLSCAKLAKRFSKAQQNAKIPIIYTERKYVKKANSKIAFVTYKNEKEIYC